MYIKVARINVRLISPKDYARVFMVKDDRNTLLAVKKYQKSILKLSISDIKQSKN